MMGYRRRFVVLSLALWLVFTLVNVTTVARAGSADLTTLEQQVHELVNKHRVEIGLAPLNYNEEIAWIARQHSRDMSVGRVGMGHEGADERGRLLTRLTNYSRFAENVASNDFPASTTAQMAVTSWLNSSGHKANIEGKFNLTGIGIAYNSNMFFFTQIFLAADRAGFSSTDSRRTDKAPRTPDFSAESTQHKTTSPHQETPTSSSTNEDDPRHRPGRVRVHGGYTQTLEAKP